MANSCDNLVVSTVVDVDSMAVDDELGYVPTNAIGTIVTGTIATVFLLSPLVTLQAALPFSLVVYFSQ